jgi:protoporphyrinogen/coproporphyrinogen III oxidase
LETALENISKILNITSKPDNYEVNLHRQCIPQYTVGHFERVENIRKYITTKKLPLSLCGAAYDGVGVNDVVFSSKNIANNLKI